MAGVAVLVPIKAFDDAKIRLAPALTIEERSALAKEMARHVISVAGAPVTVVCDDADVARWAETEGAAVLLTPGRGLDGAVTAGVDHLRSAGFIQVVVAHADLPLAHDLASLADFDGITLVPDRRDDGTNVICLPAGCGFAFSYGPGSFARHLANATALGEEVRIVREPLLAWDVDVPADLAYRTRSERPA